MLALSLVLLAAAVVFGTILVGALMRGEAGRRLPPWVAILHGALGGLGFLALLLALRDGPPRGVAEGGGAFGTFAGWLLAAALAAAAVMVAAQLRKRPAPAVVVALHATIAVAGFVMLAAYANLPP